MILLRIIAILDIKILLAQVKGVSKGHCGLEDIQNKLNGLNTTQTYLTCWKSSYEVPGAVLQR